MHPRLHNTPCRDFHSGQATSTSSGSGWSTLNFTLLWAPMNAPGWMVTVQLRRCECCRVGHCYGPCYHGSVPVRLSFAAQTYEHNFENRTLFYRFHLDSISSIRDGAAPSNSWCDVLFDSLCAPAPQAALPAYSVYETLHEPRPLDLHAQCLRMSIEHRTATDARLLTPVRQLEAYISPCQATGSEVVILRSLS